MSNQDDVKKKFNLLQEKVTTLKNKEISLDSEVKVLKSDLQEHIDKLLQLTGKGDLQAAVEYYKQLEVQLNEQSLSLMAKLDAYLKEAAGV